MPSDMSRKSSNESVEHLEEFGHVENLEHFRRKETKFPHTKRNSLNAERNDASTESLSKFEVIRRGLFRRRSLMQYFHGKKLYRAAKSRKIGANEIFFDLVIVGNVGGLGHHLRAHFESWRDIEQFIILFAAVYSSWRAQIFFWNLFDLRGDLSDKISIAATFFSLAGIAVGTSGLLSIGGAILVSVCSFLATAIPSANLIFWSLREDLLKNSANIFNQPALIGIASILSCVPYLVAAGLNSLDSQRILFWIPFGLHIILPFLTLYFYLVLHKNRPGFKRLAVAIEHLTEKYEVLTMIVLGESVLAIVFETSEFENLDSQKIFRLFIAAGGATIMLYAFQTLYSDVDNKILREDSHAIRYKAISAIVWEQAHIFYHISLVLLSTAIGISLREIAGQGNELEKFGNVQASHHLFDGVIEKAGGTAGTVEFGAKERWLFSVGWGASIILSGVIGCLHKRNRNRNIRVLFRIIIVTVVMLLMPLLEATAGMFFLVQSIFIVLIALIEFILVQMESVHQNSKHFAQIETKNKDEERGHVTFAEGTERNISINDESITEKEETSNEDVDREFRRRTTQIGARRLVPFKAPDF